jgi:hypothetical protein
MTQERQHLYIGFNQDNGCFAVGETTGFRIFNTNPYNEQVCSIADRIYRAASSQAPLKLTRKLAAVSETV